MKRTAILRFRDLVTEEGGTLGEHLRLLKKFGEVWWGWWMRQYETPPRTFLGELSDRIEREGTVRIFLFNTGESRLYAAGAAQVLVAPPGDRIATPDPERSPEYYHRGSYPAWFRLRTLREVHLTELEFFYDSFPTRPDLSQLAPLLGQRVMSLDQLRNIDVTLWAVGMDN